MKRPFNFVGFVSILPIETIGLIAFEIIIKLGDRYSIYTGEDEFLLQNRKNESTFNYFYKTRVDSTAGWNFVPVDIICKFLKRKLTWQTIRF